MMIACSKEGQLCNRLFHFSHFIANSLEHGHTLRYPFFSEYLPFFNPSLSESLAKHRIEVSNPSIIKRCLYWLTKIFPAPLRNTFYYRIILSKDTVDLGDPMITRDAKSKVVLANGWLFRDPVCFEKFASTIRSLFAFPNSIEEEINRKIAQLKSTQPNSILVGVHIRRGDYEHYLNGKYFYSNEIYIEKMLQIEKLFTHDDTSVHFLISSNDRRLSLDPRMINALHITVLEGNEIEDLCALSHCDYLIGPPSSFTMWASFMGKVPLQFIESQDYVINEKQFQVQCG